MAGVLDPDRLRPRLAGRFGRVLRFALECESTQLLLSDADPEGAVACADRQTAGRGRLGRRWEAPAGRAVLASVLLRPPNLGIAPELSLLGGLAAARTVEAFVGRPAAIKWPNDVVLDGRKVAGVLAEARAGAVVLGIGLNVNQTAGELPAASRLPPGSLRTADGSERDRGDVLVRLLAELEHGYDVWLRAGLAGLHADLATRDWLLGRPVRIGAVAGTGAGIDAGGRLLLDVGGRTVAVGSGEAELC